MEGQLTNRFCHACGNQLDPRAEICPKCGVRQLGKNGQGEKNRVAAALFAIFLGGLGIHKFYLGQVGMGIVYLIFFWSVIPVIVGFVEGVIYLTMSDADFMIKYG